MKKPLDTTTPLLSRRNVLRALPLGAAACAWPTWAQGPKAGVPGPTVLQVVDTSASQIDVSRDFLVGARAAWQETNARGGLRGKTVRHLVLEVDGSASSMRSTVDALKNLTDCVAVVGTAGDRAASQLATLEPPTADEAAISVDIGLPPDRVAATVLAHLQTTAP